MRTRQTRLDLYISVLNEYVYDQVDRRDYGEGFRHKSPQREGRREPRREKSQSEPERGGTGTKGRNAVFAAQKMVRRRVWRGGGTYFRLVSGKCRGTRMGGRKRAALNGERAGVSCSLLLKWVRGVN